MTSIDVQSEAYREYIYADGARLRIENPIEVFITESGSHRVTTMEGTTVRPTPGFLGIEWKPATGQSAFVA